VAHAIVDLVERQVVAAAGDRQVFPFDAIRVLVLAADRAARARCAAVFEGEMPLRERILQRLASTGCPVETLDLTVAYAAQPKPGWVAPDFHLTFHRTEPIDAAAGAAPATIIDLTVVHGSAEPARHSSSMARIDLGRCREVRDHRQRLLRTNHVAFTDTPAAINQSVSRQHAHVSPDAGGSMRLYDDGSAQGTVLVRSGRTIPVPPGSRGVRLQSGDEIVLGEARLSVTLRPGTTAGEFPRPGLASGEAAAQGLAGAGGQVVE
jgi:hypothetical protein